MDTYTITFLGGDKETVDAQEIRLVGHEGQSAIEATLQADGSLKIGNQSFSTPSGAAKHALDVGAIDGWLRWRVPRLGDRSIAELREEL